MKSLTAQANAFGSFHPSGWNTAVGRSLSRSQWFVGASRRLKSQAVGAAECGGSLSLRCYAAGMGSRSEPHAPRRKFASAAPMPNPSINRTCPGKPGHAGYLKRWAS
jgi:hypothetical protein